MSIMTLSLPDYWGLEPTLAYKTHRLFIVSSNDSGKVGHFCIRLGQLFEHLQIITAPTTIVKLNAYTAPVGARMSSVVHLTNVGQARGTNTNCTWSC